jgi:hypothetical protein
MSNQYYHYITNDVLALPYPINKEQHVSASKRSKTEKSLSAG